MLPSFLWLLSPEQALKTTLVVQVPLGEDQQAAVVTMLQALAESAQIRVAHSRQEKKTAVAQAMM